MLFGWLLEVETKICIASKTVFTNIKRQSKGLEQVCFVFAVRNEEFELMKKGDSRGDYYGQEPEPVVSLYNTVVATEKRLADLLCEAGRQ